MGKRYKQRAKSITVRSVDNPTEYARQYYWITVKGKKKAPPKQRKMKKRRKK